MHCGVYSIVQKYKEIACFCSLLYYIYCNSQSNSLLENLSIFPLICCKMELWFKSIFLSVCVQNFSLERLQNSRHYLFNILRATVSFMCIVLVKFCMLDACAVPTHLMRKTHPVRVTAKKCSPSWLHFYDHMVAEVVYQMF